MSELPPLSDDNLARIASEDHAAARAEAAERLKFQISIADAAMKALMLANGGAMVALFTFIGNLIAKANTTKLPFSTNALWVAFACFVAGLVAALLCHIAAFISQDRFYNQAVREAWRTQEAAVRSARTTISKLEIRIYRQGTAAYLVGIGLAIMSLCCFAVGCGFALSGVLLS
jgi:hypothetical protein